MLGATESFLALRVCESLPFPPSPLWQGKEVRQKAGSPGKTPLIDHPAQSTKHWYPIKGTEASAVLKVFSIFLNR